MVHPFPTPTSVSAHHPSGLSCFNSVMRIHWTFREAIKNVCGSAVFFNVMLSRDPSENSRTADFQWESCGNCARMVVC